MKVNELFRQSELSRDEILKRVMNSKSDAEKAMWSSQLMQNRIPLAEEKIGDYFTRLVKAHKIKKLGGGAFSQVFQHPEFKNVIVKVYVAKDQVYKKYLDWCRAHQENPYVPKVIDEVQFVSGTNKYNVVFMQKMRPLNKSLSKAFADAMPELKNNPDDLEALTDAINSNFSPKGNLRAIKSVINEYGDSDLKEVFAFIASFGADKIDLHDGNAMMRGKQLVLTDPVANDPTSRVDEI